MSMDDGLQDLIIDPGRGGAFPTTDDHPLSQNTSSVWNAYFKVIFTSLP